MITAIFGLFTDLVSLVFANESKIGKSLRIFYICIHLHDKYFGQKIFAVGSKLWETGLVRSSQLPVLH